MEIILKEDLPKLGRKGDVVKVADGFGRNYLLPYRKAIAATPANLRNIEQMRASAAHKDARDREAALALAAQLNQVRLSFERRAGDNNTLFGSVTSMDVVHGLEAQGFEVERRKIELPDPLKALGEFKVPVHLFKGVTAEVTVVIQRQAEEDGAASAE
ncbi:MAG TPA: 50S ribosomal protein L9 [Terriglobales bacterium]|nr:50S ribosomal protein L9 [Terriglobales bacterium]